MVGLELSPFLESFLNQSLVPLYLQWTFVRLLTFESLWILKKQAQHRLLFYCTQVEKRIRSKFVDKETKKWHVYFKTGSYMLSLQQVTCWVSVCLVIAFFIIIISSIFETNQNVLMLSFLASLWMLWRLIVRNKYTNCHLLSGLLTPPILRRRSRMTRNSSKLHAHFCKATQRNNTSNKKTIELCVCSTYRRPACMLHVLVQFARSWLRRDKKE